MGGFASSLMTVLLGWFRNLIAGVWSWAVDGRENFFTWLGGNWFTLFLGISLVCTAIEVLLRILRHRSSAPADKGIRPEREDRALPEEPEEDDLQTRVMAPVEPVSDAEENPYRATRRRRSDRYAARESGQDWKGNTLE